MSTVRIQVRRGTASQWTSVNPILAAGEMGVESDTNLFKFGNGSSTWTALAYANNSDVAIGEISQDAINTALSMGAGLTKSYNDGTNTIQITVDSTVVALKSYVDTGDAASVSTAAADATTKANAAQAAAISAAAADATTKANAARAAAEATAAAALSGLSNTVDSDFVPVSDLGQPNGVATLNASTKVPTSQIDTDIIALKTYVQSQDTAAILSANTYTDGQVANLIGGAPAALNTLIELSTALGADANFSTTVTNALASKAPLAAPTFTGAVVLPSTTSIGNVEGGEIAYLDGVTSSIQTQINDKAPSSGPTFSGTVTLPSTTSIGLVDATEIAYLNGVTSTVQGQLDAKAPLAGPIFTGSVTLPSTTAIGTVDGTEIGYLDGVTSTIQGQLDAKAPLAGPIFTGSVTLPSTTAIGSVDGTEIGYLNGVTSTVQGQLDSKAPLAGPIFTGSVTLPSTTDIGQVTAEEIGYVNGVTSSIQGQLDAKAPSAGAVFTGNITLPSTTSIGLVNSTEIGYLDGVTSAVQVQLDALAPKANAVFTGTFEAPVATITGAMMANGTVTSSQIADATIATGDLADGAVTSAKILDGTILTGDLADEAITSAKIANGTIVDADINASAGIATSKIAGLDTALGLRATLAGPTFTGTVVLPSTTSIGLVDSTEIGYVNGVTSAIQTQLDAKAPLASPTFTGTVSGITKTMVGLGSVDNTADASKPVSTAQATAIAAAKSEAIADATSQVNALLTGAPAALNTLDELAAALGDDANFASSVTTSLGLKAPLASPTFTGTVTVAAAGVAFTDKTQTKAGVPSRTPIASTISASTTLAGGLQDNMVPLAGAVAITIGDASNALYAVGESVDFYQISGTGASFAKTGSVNLLFTPGALLRTTYSSATAQKVSSTDWLIYGDLKA
jgi:hypothetical protein